MSNNLIFDAELIRRYDISGPRYTSYPTAAQFHEGISETDYKEWAYLTNGEVVPRALSLYFHIPFCDTVCFYCACSKIATKDKTKTLPYLDHLFKEIQIQGSLFDNDRVVEQLHLGGGTPTFLSHDQLRSLMLKVSEHFNMREDDGGEYSIEVDPREASPETIHVLREIGFNRISLGVQDTDEKVQKAVNRIQPISKTLQVLQAARSEGFKSINMDLIYGLPFQTQESFSETLNQVIASDPDRIAVYNYAHLPERFPPQRRINEADLPSSDEKLIILENAINQLTSAGYIYIGMDHFAKPDDELTLAQEHGTLQRNFQGYSAHAECDMISMGVTSIGKICDNFSQNTKDLQIYYDMLDNDQLPIVKGVELEPDDKLRSAIISQLMCHFKLDTNLIEKKWKISFWDYFKSEKEQLEQFQEDKLLEISQNEIVILPRGQLLIRNICMVFDFYLKQGSGKRFSKVI